MAGKTLLTNSIHMYPGISVRLKPDRAISALRVMTKSMAAAEAISMDIQIFCRPRQAARRPLGPSGVSGTRAATPNMSSGAMKPRLNEKQAPTAHATATQSHSRPPRRWLATTLTTPPTRKSW